MYLSTPEDHFLQVNFSLYYYVEIKIFNLEITLKVNIVLLSSHPFRSTVHDVCWHS